jgi:hypothetical protein
LYGRDALGRLRGDDVDAEDTAVWLCQLNSYLDIYTDESVSLMIMEAPSRSDSYTWDHDPGAYPRSTTVCPGLNKRYLSLICINLNAALLLRPRTRASRAKRSLDWRSTHRFDDDANRRQMTLFTRLGDVDARLSRAPHGFEPLPLSMAGATTSRGHWRMSNFLRRETGRPTIS